MQVGSFGAMTVVGKRFSDAGGFEIDIHPIFVM